MPDQCVCVPCIGEGLGVEIRDASQHQVAAGGQAGVGLDALDAVGGLAVAELGHVVEGRDWEGGAEGGIGEVGGERGKM